MAEIIFITGGARSGKSRYAQLRAEQLPGPRAYVATCPVADPEQDIELHERINRHQKDRQDTEWLTIEETVDLVGVLATHPECRVMLVDCLTLWVNNLLYTEGGSPITEDAIADRCATMVAQCWQRQGVVIFVTNEVGMGIVPENPLARRYRDLIGRCNQVMAAAADEVVLMVSSIPVPLTKKS